MRVLHLSDLHFSLEHGEDQRRLITAMLSDVESLHQDVAIDLVFFTGDLAHSGKPDEFTQAAEAFLDPLRTRLGLDQTNIFLVPGNHDVDRDRIDRFAERGAQAELNSQEAVDEVLQDPEALNRLAARLSSWDEFETQFFEDRPDSKVEPLARALRVHLDGIEVGIVCLNTAWRASGGADDRGNLLLGERQVRHALAAVEGVQLRLIAMHHPLGWLQTFDGDTAHAEFERAPSLVLTGHTHVPDPTSEISARGEAIYSRSGCLYESITKLNGYTLIDVDARDRSIQVRLRTWWPQRQEFDDATHVAHQGKIKFPFPSGRTGLPAVRVPYSEVLATLEEEILTGAVLAERLPDGSSRASDLLVPPRFLSLPYREALAALGQFEDDPPDFTVVPPIPSSEPNRVILVNGDPGSGVTMALYWLLIKGIENDDERLPILVKFDPHFKSSRFERTLLDGARLRNFPVTGKSLPHLIIAIDDVRADSVGFYDALARYISGHPEHQYVLGCHDEAHKDLHAALVDRGLDVDRVFLGPFGRTQLRQLIRSAVGSTQADAIVSRVTYLVSMNELPRTPFIMTALATVVLQEPEIASINESGLLDSYVSLLLGSDILELHDTLGLDSRRREHLLAWLSGKLTLLEKGRLGRLESEEAVGNYFRELGWGGSLSPGRVIDDLIRRRVLVEDLDGVGFRHPALQRLFAGKWMAESKEFSELILSEPLRHRQILMHAAGLRRSDRTLLKDVGLASAEFIALLPREKLNETFGLMSEKPGWSDEVPGLNELKERLEAVPAQPRTDEFDETLDELDTSIEARRARNDDQPRTAFLKEIGEALELLSSVLKSSELVDDVDLKTEKLRAVIHGWSSLAMLMAIREDQDHEIAERLGAVFEELEVDNDVQDRLQRLSDLMVLMMGLFLANSRLGSVHLEVALEKTLDDSEFMANPLYALVTTFLYCQIKLPDWPVRLRGLYERHGSHPVVHEIAQSLALVSYRNDPRLPPNDLTRLEGLLADIYSSGVPAPARAGVQVRAAVRGEVISELRKRRRLQLEEENVGDALDALDRSADDVEPGGRNKEEG